MNVLTLYHLLISFIIVIQMRNVTGQGKCEIVGTSGQTNTTIVFSIKERSAKGTRVGQIIVVHDATVPLTDVTLDFFGTGNFNKFFAISNRVSINSTHTQFDLVVNEVYDLFEQNQDKSMPQKLICEPNQGENYVLVQIIDINEKPVFTIPNIAYDLIETFPINLPFSKLFPTQISVLDKDNTDFGKLKFTVWDDNTFTSESSVVYAKEEKIGIGNDYLVNLYLNQSLSFYVKREYDMILMAKDISANPLSETIPIKLVVKPQITVAVSQPYFEHKTYSAVLRIRNKQLVNRQNLDILPTQIKANGNGHSIHYEIDTSSDFANSFSINNITGKITIIKEMSLVQSKSTNVFLIIRVFANNNQQFSDFCVVNIKIIYLPRFERRSHLVNVHRIAPVGTVVWNANAGPFVIYAIKSTELLNYYEINPETGSLTVKTQLINAVDQKITIVAVGLDGSDETDLHINIIDVDDKNAVVFLEKECSIEENKEKGVCEGLSLSKDDLIIRGNNDQTFEILNGQLRSTSSLNYEKRNCYVLVLNNKVARTTMYLTVNVIGVNEPLYFEPKKQIFGIAPWLQPDHLITTFRAKDPESDSVIRYSLVGNKQFSRVFYLNPINGEMQWIEEPTETIYQGEINAVDRANAARSTKLKIKIFNLKPSDIFTLKLGIASDSELDTKAESIETDLSNILKKQVSLILWKPDLKSERKFEYFLFAVNDDDVLSYKEIEGLAITSDKEMKEKIGNYSIEPHSASLLEAEKKKEIEMELIVIIILSIIVCAMFVAAIGIVLFKKCSSAPLQNATSSNDLLKNEDTKIEITKNHFEKKGEKKLKGESNRALIEDEEMKKTKEENSFEMKTASLSRVVSENEITFEEIMDEHADDLHEIQDLNEFQDFDSVQNLEMEYELPEVDYKPGRRKSVKFNDEEIIIDVDNSAKTDALNDEEIIIDVDDSAKTDALNDEEIIIDVDDSAKTDALNDGNVSSNSDEQQIIKETLNEEKNDENIAQEPATKLNGFIVDLKLSTASPKGRDESDTHF